MRAKAWHVEVPLECAPLCVQTHLISSGPFTESSLRRSVHGAKSVVDSLLSRYVTSRLLHGHPQQMVLSDHLQENNWFC